MIANFLKQLFGNRQSDPGLIYYVKGRKCGAITRVRIDRRNDLSRNDADQLFVRKVVVDSVCYGQVELELTFDNNGGEISRTINGGEFVDENAYAEYQRATLNQIKDKL